MRLLRPFAAAAFLAALVLPVEASDQQAPAAPAPVHLTAMSSAATSPASEAPLASFQLPEPIFLDGGGLPCTHTCWVSKNCGCDPPVIISCTGCRSCTQGPLWIQCDGALQNCTCAM